MKSDATGYRLPTEAQWEYAARGGKANGSTWNYKYAGTNEENLLGNYAWYYSNSDSTTHNVKTKTANAKGLYDMSGNVEEWCFDWYGDVPDEPKTDYKGAVSGLRRVIRSGSWSDDASSCRVPACSNGSPNNIGAVLGSA